MAIRTIPKDVLDLIKNQVDPELLPLVKLLYFRRNVSEFKLSENLNVTINQIRNMLYRLQEKNLVNSIRKKDKKKGWYIYYWTFNKKQAQDLLRLIRTKRLNELKYLLKKVSSRSYFVCTSCETRLKFEDALDHNFRCPECGELLVEESKEAFVRRIKKEITLIEKALETKVKKRKRTTTEKTTKTKKTIKPKKKTKKTTKKTSRKKKSK